MYGVLMSGSAWRLLKPAIHGHCVPHRQADALEGEDLAVGRHDLVHLRSARSTLMCMACVHPWHPNHMTAELPWSSPGSPQLVLHASMPGWLRPQALSCHVPCLLLCTPQSLTQTHTLCHPHPPQQQSTPSRSARPTLLLPPRPTHSSLVYAIPLTTMVFSSSITRRRGCWAAAAVAAAAAASGTPAPGASAGCCALQLWQIKAQSAGEWENSCLGRRRGTLNMKVWREGQSGCAIVLRKRNSSHASSHPAHPTMLTAGAWAAWAQGGPWAPGQMPGQPRQPQAAWQTPAACFRPRVGRAGAAGAPACAGAGPPAGRGQPELAAAAAAAAGASHCRRRQSGLGGRARRGAAASPCRQKGPAAHLALGRRLCKADKGAPRSQSTPHSTASRPQTIARSPALPCPALLQSSHPPAAHLAGAAGRDRGLVASGSSSATEPGLPAHTAGGGRATGRVGASSSSLSPSCEPREVLVSLGPTTAPSSFITICAPTAPARGE